MTKNLKADLAWGGGIIALALAATLARQLGYLDENAVTRIVLGATGLMVAWYGNRLPKTVLYDACARQASRVAGWSMAVSGLIYAGLWALAPMTVAFVGGCAAIIVGIAVTVGYRRSLQARMNASEM